MTQSFVFAPFEVDTATAELRRDGARVHLEPQTFDLLCLLLEHRHRIVSREEVFARLWGEWFVSEAALASRVRDLRRALGDDGQRQAYVQTIKGRGLRFVAEVAAAAAPSLRAAPSAPAQEASPTVAVLGFETLPGEQTVGALAGHLAEEVSAALTAWRIFPVVAGDAGAGAGAAARYRVGGTLRRSGEGLVVRAHLTAAGAHQRIWSDRLVGEGDAPEDIVELLALRLAWLLILEIERTEAPRAVRKPAEAMSLWELAICASWRLHRMGPGDIDQAFALAERARAIAPGWLFPQVSIANCLFLRAFQGLARGAETDTFAEACAAARTALDLDESSWQANSLVGLGELWAHGNHARAKLHVDRAITLNPGAGLAFHFAGCVTGFCGELETAIGHHQRHLAIDPTFRHRNVLESDMALWNLLRGGFEAAQTLLDRSVVWNPSFGRAHHRRIALGGLRGDADGAARAVAQLAALGQMATVGEVMATYPFQRGEHRETFARGLREGGLRP